MGKLVPFAIPVKKQTATDLIAELGPPPEDSLELQHWQHRALSIQSFDAQTDPKLSPEERRAWAIKFARAMVHATPHDELYQARQEVRADEQHLEGKTLTGKVEARTNAKKRQPKRLRAPAKK